ncbi:hypothetical protein C0J52_12706 [Blattella germanica]|nr:hypothetical protein C0J52_12706 [Blattella germanica]
MKLKPANDDAAVCISFRIKKGIHLLTNWHLFYDCPLYGEWIKETPFTLEYMARLEEDYEIKKFSFITPAPAKLDPCLKTVHSRGTLVYLDISFFPDVILHIQSLPARFKVTEYEVKRCSHIDDCVPYLTIEEQDKHGHISVSINIASEYGSFFFAVFAKSGKCNNGSCYISHTTLLTMPDRNYWNILMWFFSGLLLLLALLLISLHWRKWIIKLLRVDTPDTLRPTMLIIHEPLHEAHINVVELLVQFLEQYCYIRIHLDIRDIRLHHELRKDFNEMIYFIHKNTHSQSMISRYVLFNVIKNNFKVHGWNVARSIVKSETIFEQNGVIESVQELQLEIPVSIIPTPIEEKELLQDDLDGSSVSEQYCFEDCIFPVRISDLDLLGENSSIDSSEEQ